jgi:hypothetical protein
VKGSVVDPCVVTGVVVDDTIVEPASVTVDVDDGIVDDEFSTVVDVVELDEVVVVEPS